MSRKHITHEKRIELAALLRGGLVCADCGCAQIHKHGKLKNGLMKYRCYGCKRVFSDISDTPLNYA